jgi:hypothetical protein
MDGKAESRGDLRGRADRQELIPRGYTDPHEIGSRDV